MRSLSRLTVIVALFGSAVALPAQTPEKPPVGRPIKKSAGVPPSKQPLEGAEKVPRDGSSKLGRDPFDALFPPELVMEHQIELGLDDSERQTLRGAVQQAQAKFTDLQWRLSAETERLNAILREPVLRESAVLEQVDRVLALERDLKRTKIALLVRIRNTLTPAQQAKLAELRTRKQ